MTVSKTGRSCNNCGAWFEPEVKIEIKKVDWNAESGEFTIYGSTTCPSCGYSDNPENWWEKWKSIPVSVIKPAQCPACGSADIHLTTVDSSREKDEIVISASFLCRNCNGRKKQFVRGIKDVWQRVKSISIGPAQVTFHNIKD